MSETFSIPEPRLNFSFFGHEKAEKTFLEAWNSGRMPHAWLLTGPSGIGKATMAFRAARFILSASSQRASTLNTAVDHPVSRLVASGGHPDLLVVERQKDEKKGSLKAGISVDEVRKVNSFLRMTADGSGWRVVIIDEADAMNINAQNALLKILEEPPPKTLLILTAETPGAMLVTIRSRVRRLTMKPLDDVVVQERLEKLIPGLEAAKKKIIVSLAEGSIGRALDLAGSDKFDLYYELLNLLRNYPHLDYKTLHIWSDKFSGSNAHEKFSTTAELFIKWLMKVIRGGVTKDMTETFPGEKDLVQNLLQKRSLRFWVEKTDEIKNLLEQGESTHLDRKQLWMKVFFSISEESSLPV